MGPLCLCVCTQTQLYTKKQPTSSSRPAARGALTESGWLAAGWLVAGCCWLAGCWLAGCWLDWLAGWRPAAVWGGLVADGVA